MVNHLLVDLSIEISKDISKRVATDVVYAAFNALVREEIHERSSTNLLTSSFKIGHDHLENALREHRKKRRNEHIEHARCAFMEAVNKDSPFIAIRSAFYVGVCHHLLKERPQSDYWFERSLSMSVDVEQKLLINVFTVGAFTQRSWVKALVALGVPFHPASSGFLLTGLAAAEYRKKILTSEIDTLQKQRSAIEDMIRRLSENTRWNWL